MKPLKQTVAVPPRWTAFYGMAAKQGLSIEAARQIYDHELRNTVLWVNDLYAVQVNEIKGGGWHLSIRRQDRAACRDWRHFQEIKNQLCGPECEGVELYPAESRLLDGANQFHLWVGPPGFRFPVGYGIDANVRSVCYESDPEMPGKQRPSEETP